mmetsp:Transcript_88019/g.252232  ORF Transcript_88019/g.252232 Transcript_88019/m.252232 type:complete len:218 (-) Transcript_88019:403-1056(-)
MFSAQMRPCLFAGPPNATAQVSSPPIAEFRTWMASPTAQMHGSVTVLMRSSTFTCPRLVSSRPASAAKAVLGRTPNDTMTKSAGSRAPDFKTTSDTEAPVGGSSKEATASLRWSWMPLVRNNLWICSAISGSNGAKTWSMASTIDTWNERWASCSAISRPMKPPPQMTTRFGWTAAMCRSMAAVSSMDLRVKCPSLAMPGIACGTMASQPTESTKWS